MLAVQGIYESGRITLKNPAPMKKATVLVIFPAEVSNPNKEITRAEAFQRFKKYRRNGNTEIDYEAERDEYLNEKYGSVN